MDYTFSIQFIPLIFSVFFSFGLLIYLLKYNESPVVKTLSVILKGAFIWSLSHLFEYGSNQLSSKIFWISIGYIGIELVPIGWFLMSLLYSGKRHLVNRNLIIIISLIPVLTVLFNFTNSFHGLMRYDVGLDTNGPFAIITRTPGVWFWVNFVYVNALMLTGTLLMFKRMFSPPKIQQKQILLVTAAVIIPWLGTFIMVFSLIPALRIDPSPSMIPFSIFLIVLALYPFNIFDVIPIARDFILEHLPDGIVVTDPLNRIIDYNPAFKNMFHLQKIPFSTPLSSFSSILNIPESLLKKNSFFKRETVCTLNGDSLALEFQMQPLMQNGSVIGKVYYFQDITEKKRMIESLSRTQRLDSLGTLAGGIAHEFNNMLSAVYGYAELAKNSSTDPKIIDYLEKSLSSSDRARDLTEQLVTFSKGGAPICREEQLFPFFAERIKLLVRKTKIDLSFDIPHNLPDAWIDKNQVGLVFDGIITNAKEAMLEKGTISIKAVVENVEEHSIHKLKAGRYIKIMIKDSGTGIDKEILPKIFDPFFTTKKFGRGMGLSACYSIAEQHGGTIEVETEIGKGTQFTVYFKAAG